MRKVTTHPIVLWAAETQKEARHVPSDNPGAPGKIISPVIGIDAFIAFEGDEEVRTRHVAFGRAHNAVAIVTLHKRNKGDETRQIALCSQACERPRAAPLGWSRQASASLIRPFVTAGSSAGRHSSVVTHTRVHALSEKL